MGYAFSVYGVDLVRLKKLWGSEDTKLAAAVKKQQATNFTESDAWFAHKIAAGAPSLATALDEILAGKVTKKQHGFQYGYALEALCRHLGKRIDDEDLTWFDEILDPLLKRAKQPKLGKLLGRGTLPLAIPKPADFPEIGTIDAKRATAVGKALDAIEPLVEDDDVAELVIAEVRGWLARAKKQKRQIVWFVY